MSRALHERSGTALEVCPGPIGAVVRYRSVCGFGRPFSASDSLSLVVVRFAMRRVAVSSPIEAYTARSPRVSAMIAMVRSPALPS